MSPTLPLACVLTYIVYAGPKDPTQQFANQVSELIKEVANLGHLSKDVSKYLTPISPRTARFYHLPKIHKILPDGTVPGRPIVSSCGVPTERISEFVNHHFQPLVLKILKVTTDFLNKLNTLDTLTPGCILMTLDIRSLCMNIPHKEGMEACRWVLDTRQPLDPPTPYLIRMMERILTLNNFSFNGENYLQIQGTAMGTRMAPSYANLFMADLEEDLMASMRTKPRIWCRRYIDDIFAIWEHSQDALDLFLQQINLLHPTIKFMAETSMECVTFLDTTVILEGGTLHTDLYTKPVDTHKHLSPTAVTQNTIPYSQGLRLKRICSRMEDYEKRAKKLKDHLLACGHEPSSVEQQIQRAARIPHEEALQPRQQQHNNNAKCR